MKLIVLSRKKGFIILASIIMISLLFVLFQQHYSHKEKVTMVMGGKFYKQASEDDKDSVNTKMEVEKYLRPSKLPVLNDRYSWRFFDNYFGKKASEITIPNNLLNNPEETILNYFSILREAANFQHGKGAGCGSIGYGNTPYPVTYNFLSSSYQDKLSYEKYEDTFLNILHMSLIKYREVPVFENPNNIIRYFIELETIEGTEKRMANFAYYYGFVDLLKENGQYKISNLEFHGEDYLCAPLHGWSHDAELSVQVRYGGWCSLIDKMYPTNQKEYIKNISFKGTDGNDYLIVFYQLTNDTDIEIAQYIRNKNGGWTLTKLDPEKCLKDKAP